MTMRTLSVGGVGVLFEGELDDGFLGGFTSLFARRYLPDVFMAEIKPEVIVERFRGSPFRIFSSMYDVNGVDRYKIESSIPRAYGNESPVFFLLQATARAASRKGRVFMTDSVSVMKDGKAILFVGYPHTGKSTISALAVSDGLRVLSTENTVVEPREEGLFVTGGTSVLVYDPRVEKMYGIKLEYDETTRSGYRIVDLDGTERRRELKKGIKIEKIVVLHASFGGGRASLSAVRGRKVKKTLWYFSTSLLKGMDYYDPAPLYMPVSEEINRNMSRMLDVAVRHYSDRMIEAFGNHLEVFEAVMHCRP